MTVFDPRSSPGDPGGEVVESASTSFLVQAAELDRAPAFGTFVAVASEHGGTVYGVVAHVETNGIDTNARPIMRGHDAVRDEAIYAENPDLRHVLRTTFQALIVGHATNGAYRQYLPDRPPRLHFSVSEASTADVRGFTDAGLDYLGTLLAVMDVPTDELIAANVRYVAAVRSEPEFANRAGRELAQLLRADYPRLTTILRRMVPVGSM